MSNLLTLTFHERQRGKRFGLLREDTNFKHFAITSGFVATETMAETPPAGELMAVDANGTGLEEGSYSSLETLKQITLQGLGLPCWRRKAFDIDQNTSNTLFEKWLDQVLAKPAACLLLGGHHGLFEKAPVLWGRTTTPNSKLPYAMLLPRIAGNTPYLTVSGMSSMNGKVVARTRPRDMTAALSQCCLIVVMGCSGSEKIFARHWQDCVSNARNDRARPLVLGWYGTHYMPRDKYAETFSERFWNRMTVLGSNLQKVCDEKSDQVIGAWGGALKDTFADSAWQKHLWYDKNEGAGAFDSNGQEWRVTSPAGPIAKYNR